MATYFNVSYDKIRYSSKPHLYDIEQIPYRIIENKRRITGGNIRDFIEDTGQDGHAFCPAIFREEFESVTMTRARFKEMQLFVLDFNGVISFDEVKERAEQYELPMLYAYETYSSVGGNRFRIAFRNDCPVVYADAAEIMIEALLTIFPEADPRSKDVCQVFLGGKKLIYFDESVPSMNIESLIRNMYLCLYHLYKENYRRKIYDFSHRTRFMLTPNNYLNIYTMYHRTNIKKMISDGILSKDTSSEIYHHTLLYI